MIQHSVTPRILCWWFSGALWPRLQDMAVMSPVPDAHTKSNILIHICHSLNFIFFLKKQQISFWYTKLRKLHSYETLATLASSSFPEVTM